MHTNEESMAAMKRVSEDMDICIVEIGGTVGDLESLPFIEDIRQLRQQMGRDNTMFVHVTLVPWIGAAGELKTKPTQHSVKELLSVGIQPDILLCRTDRFLSKEIKGKIALFCNVEEEAVITAKDVASIYEVPLVFAREEVDTLALRYLKIEAKERNLHDWEAVVQRLYNPKDEVSIAIVGKYVEYEDSYKSLKEALVHGALAHNIYGMGEISERHRHRYEFNREYEAVLTGGGLRLSGATPDGTYVEMVEIPSHPHFIGCQFHPEFKSKPLEPHPLFASFIRASYENRLRRKHKKETAELEHFHRPVTRRS